MFSVVYEEIQAALLFTRTYTSLRHSGAAGNRLRKHNGYQRVQQLSFRIRHYTSYRTIRLTIALPLLSLTLKI